MSKKNLIKLGIAAFCVIAAIGAGLVVRSSLAYLSDASDAVINSFSFGNVTAEIQETFTPVKVKTGENSYTKKIEVKNGGTVPAYVRVWLEFSSVDVEKVSQVKAGGSWKTLSELKANPPSGWAYESTGELAGYFYTKDPVAAGKNSPVLITEVKSTFKDKTADTNNTINETARDYDIFVYAESVQQMKLDGSGLNDSYQTAWSEFLGLK